MTQEEKLILMNSLEFVFNQYFIKNIDAFNKDVFDVMVNALSLLPEEKAERLLLKGVAKIERSE